MIPMVRLTAIVLLSFCLWAAPALADALDDAKAAGEVGEKVDGFLAVVDANAPPAIHALVDKINAARRAKYAEIAKKQGTSLDAVAKIVGQKLTSSAPAGEYILGADDQWRKK